jgi:hypothetical protein
MLDKRDTWKMTVEPSLAPSFAAEVTAASASIKGAVLSTAVTAAGRASCEKLAEDARPTSPYWSWAVNRYCQHWGGHLKFDPQPPHLRSSLVVSGDVVGIGGHEAARLRARRGVPEDGLVRPERAGCRARDGRRPSRSHVHEAPCRVRQKS